jgi:hypothetical protein
VKYNRQDAIALNDELNEIVKRLTAAIPKMGENGPVINDLCERLGQAITLLQTVIRS